MKKKVGDRRKTTHTEARTFNQIIPVSRPPGPKYEDKIRAQITAGIKWWDGKIIAIEV